MSGEIPPTLCLLQAIEELDISDNLLTGVIPEDLALLCDDKPRCKIDFSKNDFDGKMPMKLVRAKCCLSRDVNWAQNSAVSLPDLRDLDAHLSQLSHADFAAFVTLVTEISLLEHLESKQVENALDAVDQDGRVWDDRVQLPISCDMHLNRDYALVGLSMPLVAVDGNTKPFSHQIVRCSAFPASFRKRPPHRWFFGSSVQDLKDAFEHIGIAVPPSGREQHNLVASIRYSLHFMDIQGKASVFRVLEMEPSLGPVALNAAIHARNIILVGDLLQKKCGTDRSVLETLQQQVEGKNTHWHWVASLEDVSVVEELTRQFPELVELKNGNGQTA